MALTPSTVPTSFVPKQPVNSGQRFIKSGSNTLLIVSLIILVLTLVACGGVFAYERYLLGVRDTKSDAVKEAEKTINAESVEEFVRLRDRFMVASSILDGHVTSSRFFELLEKVTLANVRFDSLSFELTDDRSAEILMTGSARTFNALAAQSSLLAEEKYIKRAIFSDIALNEDNNTVSFMLAADIDPRLLTYLVDDSAPSDAALESSMPVPPEPETESTPEEGGEEPTESTQIEAEVIPTP
ncbi:MAG: hypothetical protein WBK28_03690 [Minisyncoccia bacterium]